LHGRLLYGTDMPLLNTGITSPWFHAYHLSPRKLWRITGNKNPWDRDVELKRALGVTDDILNNSRNMFAKHASNEVQP